MKTGHQRIAIDLIEMNTGQIAGLPSNPRQWTKAQLDNLKASIEETPELLEARGCIVDYHEGKYVCLGGNMRYAACKALGMSELPCYVVPEGTTILKKKEIVAKDNVSMGGVGF
jgi:ParB-like chromosome segregation protein Spo0J